MVGHHALRRRQNRDAEPVVDARQIAYRDVDAAAGLRYPRHFADHRLAFEILQLDLDLAAAVLVLDGGIATDVTLVLEHVEDAHAQARVRSRHLRLLAHLRIVDARDQVAERIIQGHASLLTSSTSTGPGSGLWSRAHAARCGLTCACDRTSAAGRSARSGCEPGSPTSCAAEIGRASCRERVWVAEGDG